MPTRDGEGKIQYGAMHVFWCRLSCHSGEEYELHLCESCFFAQAAEMMRVRWLAAMDSPIKSAQAI